MCSSFISTNPIVANEDVVRNDIKMELAGRMRTQFSNILKYSPIFKPVFISD